MNIKTTIMKNLLKLPVLLLAVMLVASCGDSKKKLSPVEQAAVDGKKTGEMACELSEVFKEEGFDSEKAKKMMKDMQDFGDKVEDKYGPDGSASDEVKEAFEKAMQAEMDDCK